MRKVLAFLVSMTLALVASAQAVPALLVGADPSALATGAAGLARSAGAFAVDTDAAAMSLDENRFDAAATYGMWAPKTADNLLVGLGVFYKVNEKLAVGLSGRMFRDKPYEASSATGQVSGSFSPNDLIAGLGLSYSVVDGFSIGLTGRFVSSAIANDMKGTAIAADLTAMYARNAFRAALGICNLGSPISYGGASYALPMLARVGAAYSVAGLTASAEADYLFAGALMAGLGVEYCIQDIVFLRGGFHYGDAAKALPTFVSLGLGAKFSGVHLDLSFLTASKTLGNSLMVGLGYAF
ncbi:MAG: PorV/PorQ family protein [Bacteroidales bacterium]|nr:PorV/PorQ family protein [Bacteroidales bacterium]